MNKKILPQKKAFLLALKKAGSQANLARWLGCTKSTIHYWLNKEIDKPLQKLMSVEYAELLEKVTNIKGIAQRVCPVLKKFQKR